MMSLWNDACEAALAKSPQLLCGLPVHTRLVGHGVKLLLHMWWGQLISFVAEENC